jgi:hypothetical protein
LACLTFEFENLSNFVLGGDHNTPHLPLSKLKMFPFELLTPFLLVLAIATAIIAVYIAVGYIAVIVASWLGAWIWAAVVACWATIPFEVLLVVAIEAARAVLVLGSALLLAQGLRELTAMAKAARLRKREMARARAREASELYAQEWRDYIDRRSYREQQAARREQEAARRHEEQQAMYRQQKAARSRVLHKPAIVRQPPSYAQVNSTQQSRTAAQPRLVEQRRRGCLKVPAMLKRARFQAAADEGGECMPPATKRCRTQMDISAGDSLCSRLATLTLDDFEQAHTGKTERAATLSSSSSQWVTPLVKDCTTRYAVTAGAAIGTHSYQHSRTVAASSLPGHTYGHSVTPRLVPLVYLTWQHL